MWKQSSFYLNRCKVTQNSRNEKTSGHLFRLFAVWKHKYVLSTANVDQMKKQRNEIKEVGKDGERSGRRGGEHMVEARHELGDDEEGQPVARHSRRDVGSSTDEVGPREETTCRIAISDGSQQDKCQQEGEQSLLECGVFEMAESAQQDGAGQEGEGKDEGDAQEENDGGIEKCPPLFEGEGLGTPEEGG